MVGLVQEDSESSDIKTGLGEEGQDTGSKEHLRQRGRKVKVLL